MILDVLNDQSVKYRDRVFNPVTTIWGFLSQVLSDDHSCRDAVARIIAHRAASGIRVCSPNTASYCNARRRMQTGVFRTLAKRTAQELQSSAAEGWKWNGRSVFIADGSHVSMPDTPKNQARYPRTLRMREVAVDARDKNNRVKQFKVVTTILDAAIDGEQIGSLYERRWDGEIDQASCRSSGSLYLGSVAG